MDSKEDHQKDRNIEGSAKKEETRVRRLSRAIYGVFREYLLVKC